MSMKEMHIKFVERVEERERERERKGREREKLCDVELLFLLSHSHIVDFVG
jgi:hypothetical protein